MPKHNADSMDYDALRTRYTSYLSKGKWAGYVLMSDGPLRPERVWLKPSDLPDWESLHQHQALDTLPNFFWEAHLYCERTISVSIRQVDGKWLVGETAWDGNEPAELIGNDQDGWRDISLLSAGISGNPRLHFLERWLPVEDAECEGMEVLQPAWTAFVGFAEGKAGK